MRKMVIVMLYVTLISLVIMVAVGVQQKMNYQPEKDSHCRVVYYSNHSGHHGCCRCAEDELPT